MNVTKKFEKKFNDAATKFHVNAKVKVSDDGNEIVFALDGVEFYFTKGCVLSKITDSRESSTEAAYAPLNTEVENGLK